MKTIKDGWHRIKGYEIYVKNGRVMRGMVGGGTVYPYLDSRRMHCLVNAVGVKVSTFARGRYVMK